eukprot:8441493-Pyramimonas_sp.AAC.1
MPCISSSTSSAPGSGRGKGQRPRVGRVAMTTLLSPLGHNSRAPGPSKTDPLGRKNCSRWAPEGPGTDIIERFRLHHHLLSDVRRMANVSASALTFDRTSLMAA